VSFFESLNRHVVRNNIVGEVHVLVEERLELVVGVETFSALVWQNKLPHELSLAHGAECLILWSIEVRGVFWEDAIRIGVRATISIGLVISPVIEAAVSASDLDFWLLFFHRLITAASLLFVTSNTTLTACKRLFFLFDT